MNAVISDCGKYRYELTRTLDSGVGSVLWIMLNPSTADASIDDPTIRKCKGFTRRWGFRRITVMNLFAFRATKPIDLAKADDPQGPENIKRLIDRISMDDRVVFAWGASVNKMQKKWLAGWALTAFRDAVCLGTTKGGHPRHPLYVGYDTEPVPYDWAKKPGNRADEENPRPNVP